MGGTPYLMAMGDLQDAADGDGEKAQAMMQFHNLHLNALNDMFEQAGDIKRLINLYHGRIGSCFRSERPFSLKDRKKHHCCLRTSMQHSTAS
jgi:hypothetical protein